MPEQRLVDSRHVVHSGHRRPARTGWVAVAHADLDYYEAATALGDLEAPRLPFPRDWPARTFVLSGERAWIGRRGRTRGHRPEIDLGGWPFDPGVSRLHAVLLAVPDGWALLDPGSAGGTSLNYPTARVPVDEVTPLVDGDRIHLGAWTTITLRRV
jgi:FHA domain